MIAIVQRPFKVLGNFITVYPGFRIIRHNLFKPDNSHVEKQEFALSDDIETLYYVTDYGQLISAANSVPDIQKSEILISRSPLADKVYPTGRYNFDCGVLYDFAISGFTDFEEYLDAIAGRR